MNGSSPYPSDTELRRRRLDIRRGLARVNMAGVIIVAVVIALALAAGFAAFRANRNAEDARRAGLRAEEQLRASYLAQSTAGRLSRVMGRKRAGLEAVAAAARIKPARELRDEAIAHLALVDFEAGVNRELPDHSLTRTLTPDFDLYAGGDAQGNVRLIRTSDQTEVLNWRGTNVPVQMLLFSPNSRYLAVVYPSQNLFVLDVEQRAVTARAGRFNAFDFADQGNLLALLRDDHAVHFLESASGSEARNPLPVSDKAYDITFHETERKVAVNVGTGIEVWDWEAGKKLETLDHNRPITSMAWRGRYLALGDREGDLDIRDLPSKTVRHLSAHKDYISRLLLTHRADLLVSASYDGLTRVWDPQTGYLLFETAKGFPTDFSRDDTKLGNTTSSNRGGFAWWPVSSPVGYRALNCADGSDGNIWQTDFTPDNRRLVVAKRNGAHVFDLATGARVAFRPLRESRGALFVDHGRTLLTVGDNRISLWPVEAAPAPSNQFTLGTARHIALPKTGRVDTATLSRDGHLVALPLTDTDALLLDLEDPSRKVLFEKALSPKLMAISPDKKWVVSGAFHGRGTWLWDAATGRKVRELDEGNAAPYFSPDGTQLLVAGHSEYRLYDTRSWTIVRRESSESPTSLPNRAAFSDDGRVLAIVKELHHVELLDPRNWEVLANLIAPEAQVITWLGFSRDGTVLAAATHQDQVQLWDLDSIRRELRLSGLDWDQTPASGLATVAAIGATSSASASNSFGVVARFLAVTAAGVGLVIFCAWVVLRRQRRLIDNYVQIDQLIERRNEELEAARTGLIHSQKMKALGTLAAGIAHDFNNLLSVIRMSNKLIGREAKENETIRENVIEIEQAVQQGKSVVGSMLGYSREASDAPGPFSLPELVEDTVALLSKQFLSGIALTLELDRHSPLVNGSRGRLEQILLNLVVNAAEAMNGNGNLLIRVQRVSHASGPWVLAPRAADSYVEMVVTDSGPGIASDVLPRIFEPFFTTKNVGAEHGTGLGLSMLYNIARQDGLGIRVETAPGNGASFRIVIPVDGPQKSLSA